VVRIKRGWESQTEEELVAALLSGHTPDLEQALAELRRRHQVWLEPFMRSKLAPYVIEDTIQDTWFDFYRKAIRDGRVDSVRGLLTSIAQGKRADAAEKVRKEREIEHDLVPQHTDYDDATQVVGGTISIEENLIAIEEQLRRRQYLATGQYYPFTDGILGDCQRVLWVLRVIFDYPSKTVARLMGKDVNNIDSQISQARAKVRRYYRSEQYELDQMNNEMPHVWAPTFIPAQATLVEYFSERALPRLTPDELKPLGLTNEEIEQGYRVSMMLPRWFDEELGQCQEPPFLVLTRKSEWKEMERLFNRLSAHPEDLPNEFPEQALIEVHVEDGNLLLNRAPIHQMVPDDPDYPVYPDTYVSDHKHRVRVPVILAPYSDSLYTPKLMARWPFVKAKDARGEGRDIYYVENGQIAVRRPG
jgi:DNA-directed RNA polymerase specialized sigma24 family protein